MADIRIKDLATTATTTASDDFMAVDGTTNGTRKMNAAAPAFLTSVTTPSLTSPASTNLTLAGGAGNSSIILTPAGTGNVGIGTTSPVQKLQVGSTLDATSNFIQIATDHSRSQGISFLRSGSIETVLAVVSQKLQYAINTASYSDAHLVTASKFTIDNAGITTIANSTAGSASAGALVVTGGLSAGNNGGASYFGGAVTVIGLAEGISAQFGSSTSSQIYIRDNSINCASGNNGAETLRFNYVGYANGITQFRNSVFHDGKTGVVATFTGSDKSATFAGAVTVGGNVGFYNNAPVAKPTGVAVTAAAIHAALVTLNLIAA